MGRLFVYGFIQTEPRFLWGFFYWTPIQPGPPLSGLMGRALLRELSRSWSTENGIPPVALAISPKVRPTHGLGIAGPSLFLEARWTQ